MEMYGLRLLVTKFDECFSFYSSTLGLTKTWGEKGGSYASFNLGKGVALSIYNSDLMAQAIGNEEKTLPLGYREKSALILHVDNVDAVFSSLSNNGVAFITEPKDMTGWGIRACHLHDPEGNLIEIFTELPKEKWNKDLLEDSLKFE